MSNLRSNVISPAFTGTGMTQGWLTLPRRFSLKRTGKQTGMNIPF
jgi:hypothetical protein